MRCDVGKDQTNQPKRVRLEGVEGRIGKTHPNRLTMPKNSMSMPVMHQPHSTNTMPKMKQAEPLRLPGRQKKMATRCGPIRMVVPAMKSTFPITRNALSKSRTTPRNRKNAPKPVRPMPISARVGARVGGRARERQTNITH